MTPEPAGFIYADAERAQLLAWVRLSTSDKIAFFEEMVELAWHSGALTPQRLALRDAWGKPDAKPGCVIQGRRLAR